MTLNNMKAEVRRRGITQRQIAESMDMSENNLSLKINERIPMTVDEAKFIQRNWLYGNSLDYLLESDGNIPNIKDQSHGCIDAIGDILTKSGSEPDPAVDSFIAEMHEAVNSAFGNAS